MKNPPKWFKAAMADGGAVRRREDGGRISEDSKREASRLRRESSENSVDAPLEVARAAPGIIGGAVVEGLSRGRLGKVLGRAISYGSAGAGVLSGAQKIGNSFSKNAEMRHIERGLVKEGEEDRKHGGRVSRKDGGKNWIAGAIKHKGSLRKALGAKEGEPISAKKLDKATHSSSSTLRRRAVLAKTLKGFK